MPDDPDVQKRVLRAELRERRQNMPGHERERATEGFTARLEELVGSTGAESISCYLSMPTEPDTRPFVNWAEARGIRVLFPVTREDGLLDWTVGEEEVETLGLHGVPEAVGELLGPMAINDVDLILVPGRRRRPHGHAPGVGPGLFRQDPRIDGKMSSGVRRRLRQRIRRAGAARGARPGRQRRRDADAHHRVLNDAPRSRRAPHAHVFLPLHRMRQRVRHPPGVHRRRAHRVRGVRRSPAQALQHDRRDLQRLGLLPHRLARRRREVGVGCRGRRLLVERVVVGRVVVGRLLGLLGRLVGRLVGRSSGSSSGGSSGSSSGGSSSSGSGSTGSGSSASVA